MCVVRNTDTHRGTVGAKIQLKYSVDLCGMGWCMHVFGTVFVLFCSLAAIYNI